MSNETRIVVMGDKTYVRKYAGGWPFYIIFNSESKYPDIYVDGIVKTPKAILDDDIPDEDMVIEADNGEEVVSFTQKWDGCQHLNLEAYNHTCNDEQCDDLTFILKSIRKHGFEMIAKAGGTPLV